MEGIGEGRGRANPSGLTEPGFNADGVAGGEGGTTNGERTVGIGLEVPVGQHL